MANLHASKKNIRKIKKQTYRNRVVITGVKSIVKGIRNGKSNDLNYAYQKIDSACAKGKIHKNKANRLKSRLAISINKRSNGVELNKTADKVDNAT
jgi:small subunit ribosomal protein S20